MRFGAGGAVGALALVALTANLVAPVAPASAAPLPQAPACAMFPADNVWRANISKLPLDPKSATYVASIGATSNVHPDFWSGTYDEAPIGIPYNVVPGTQAPVKVTFDYADESDPGPYPVPANALIEGGPTSTGDRHVLTVNKDTCSLSELYSAYPQADGSWQAGSGAIWSLNSDALRPAGWTSADAAGLPILPGLVRYDEVASGVIDHAIRITVPASDARYIWPARHEAGTANSALPPMGERFRLKASFNISTFSPANQVILQALKTYGAIVADNGSPWYLSGAPDSRWNNDDLHLLGQIAGSNFEAVDESSLMVNPNSGATASAAALPAVSTSPAAGHVFATRPVNTTSPRQIFTVTNTGNATLLISAVSETGSGFTVAATTCSGAAVAPGKTCTVKVSFTPTALGSFTGVIALQDNAADSPQAINVSGKGEAKWGQT
jgi:hypothetical protein